MGDTCYVSCRLRHTKSKPSGTLSTLVITMCQCRFIDFGKCPSVVQRCLQGVGAWHLGGQGLYGNSRESKTALKIKCINKNKLPCLYDGARNVYSKMKMFPGTLLDFFPRGSVSEESEKRREKKKQLTKPPAAPEGGACCVFSTSFSAFNVSLQPESKENRIHLLLSYNSGA